MRWVFLPPSGLACPASIPLSSGVAMLVNVPNTTCLIATELSPGVAASITFTSPAEKWFKFIGSQSGGRVLTVSETSGNPDVTIYYGTCDSLTQLTTFNEDSTYTTLVLGAGVVVYVKITGEGVTATVTAAMWTPANGSPYLVIDPLASGGAFSDSGTTPAVVGDAVYQVATNLYGGSIGANNPARQTTLSARPILRSDGLEFPLAANVGCMDFTSTVSITAEPYTLYSVFYRPAAGVTIIPISNRNLSSVSAPKQGSISYSNTNVVRTQVGASATNTASNRTENGLLCLRWRRTGTSGTSLVKVTGVEELMGMNDDPCFQTIGGRPRTVAIYNNNSATRYRGWILVKSDTVEDGTSALWEAWIATNWGVGP